MDDLFDAPPAEAPPAGAVEDEFDMLTAGEAAPPPAEAAAEDPFGLAEPAAPAEDPFASADSAPAAAPAEDPFASAPEPAAAPAIPEVPVENTIDWKTSPLG